MKGIPLTCLVTRLKQFDENKLFDNMDIQDVEIFPHNNAQSVSNQQVYNAQSKHLVMRKQHSSSWRTFLLDTVDTVSMSICLPSHQIPIEGIKQQDTLPLQGNTQQSPGALL